MACKFGPRVLTVFETRESETRRKNLPRLTPQNVTSFPARRPNRSAITIGKRYYLDHLLVSGGFIFIKRTRTRKVTTRWSWSENTVRNECRETHFPSFTRFLKDSLRKSTKPFIAYIKRLSSSEYFPNVKVLQSPKLFLEQLATLLKLLPRKFELHPIMLTW